MAKTSVKQTESDDYEVMGQKSYAKRTKTPTPKQTVQSAKAAAHKPKMAAQLVKHGSGKPTGLRGN
jgi:hypothetical protein